MKNTRRLHCCNSQDVIVPFMIIQLILVARLSFLSGPFRFYIIYLMRVGCGRYANGSNAAAGAAAADVVQLKRLGNTPLTFIVG